VTELHGHHRATLEKIFRHPASGNIEWREVKSLRGRRRRDRRAQGQGQGHARRETEVLQPPRGKDIDAQMIVDLRRMLTRAGLDDQ
jgi:hypothetical protein